MSKTSPTRTHKLLSLGLSIILTVYSSVSGQVATGLLLSGQTKPRPRAAAHPPGPKETPTPAPTLSPGENPDPSLEATPTPTPTPAPTYTIKPARVQTGKKPDVTITTDTGDLSGVEPQEPDASSGVSFDSVQHVGAKTIIIRVNVDEDADIGTIPIALKKGDETVDVVELTITEFKPRKISRGPTPDDIDFEVDAMWNVLPYKLVKTNFGRRAADSFYAIEIFLGNNSGFDLQVVGVGFETSSEGRTVDEYGKPLAVLTDDKGKPILDEYGNKYIEAVDAQGKRILKDGKPTYRILRKHSLPTSDHRLVRGVIEVDQLYGSRAFTLNLIGGLGTLVSGFIPFFHRPNPKANFSSFSSVLNGQLKEGFGIAAPDLTVSQLNRLENLVLHDGLTVLNNSQAKTIVFFPRHIVELDKAEREKIDKGESMWPLINKLGELVIVGKPIITYRNREIVATKPQPATPSATPPTPVIGAPTVTGFVLTGGAPPVGNAPDKDITISGTNFVNVADVKIGGVSTTFIVNTATQITAKVPRGATTGRVEVTTPSGHAESPTDFIAQPRITTISPKTGGPNTAVTITGFNLENATAVTFGGVSGTINGQSTKTQVVVSVPTGAISGTVAVTTTPGGTANSPDTEKFVAQPILDPLTTTQGGAEDALTITGKNLDDAEVFFGNVSAEKLENDSVHVKVKVPPNAVTDVITVKTPAGKATTGKFTFVSKPVVTGFSLNGGAESAAVTAKGGDTLVITGQNLNGATVKFGDADVSPTNVSDTQITLKVPTNLAGGKVTIKIKTPGGEATNDKFTFVPAPAITGFSLNSGAETAEVSGKAGDTLAINGRNLRGATEVKFGDTVVTPTSIEDAKITVTVPSGLSAGAVTIKITTPGGVMTTNKFTATQ
jgi:hypothetical protein